MGIWSLKIKLSELLNAILEQRTKKLESDFKKVCVDSIEQSPDGFLFHDSIGLFNPIKGLYFTIPQEKPKWINSYLVSEIVLIESSGIEPKSINIVLDIRNDPHYKENLEGDDYEGIYEYIEKLVNIKATEYLLGLCEIYKPIAINVKEKF